MKAAVYYENGGPDVFKYEDVPDPECHRKGIVNPGWRRSPSKAATTLKPLPPARADGQGPHIVGYQAAGPSGRGRRRTWTNIKVGDKVVTTRRLRPANAELRAGGGPHRLGDPARHGT